MKKIFALLGIENKADFWAFVRQVFKFGLVGFSNTAVAFAVYYTLVFLGVHYIAANILGYIISVLNAFFWNRRFVFKKREGGVAKQLVKVYAAYGFTLVLSTGTLFLMVDILGISELIAPILNIFVTFPTNFLVNKFWAFR